MLDLPSVVELKPNTDKYGIFLMKVYILKLQEEKLSHSKINV
jgi:hypothetical protein